MATAGRGAGPWQVYDRLLAAAAIDDRIEEVLIGLTWTLCRAASAVGLAMSPGPASRALPWLPELAEFGVDYLAGVRVADADSLRQTLAEGAGTRIFELGVRYCLADLSAWRQNLTTASPPRSIQP